MTLGDEHVAPLAAAFLARHPEVRLDLVCDDRPANVIEEGFDVALRVRSGLRDSALVARRLAVIRSVVCGSPEYVARRGTPLVPDDLLAHDCLHFGLVSVASYWALRTPEGSLSVPVVPRAHFTTASALRHAALAAPRRGRASRASEARARGAHETSRRGRWPGTGRPSARSCSCRKG